MTLPVFLTPEAADDLSAAIESYEATSAGRGVSFLAEFESLLATAADNPLMYPPYVRSARKAVMDRFPWIVFYRVGFGRRGAVHPSGRGV